MKRIFTGIIAITVLCGCSKKNVSDSPDSTDIPVAEASGVALGYKSSKPVNAIPMATAFRMSGDYADHVAITIVNGNITYFPAPTDITDSSKPISLGNGWWLNRQGISANSVFTRYTFEEYSKLRQVPTVKELKASVIPGARVTEMYTLPYSISEASSHISEIREILK